VTSGLIRATGDACRRVDACRRSRRSRAQVDVTDQGQLIRNSSGLDDHDRQVMIRFRALLRPVGQPPGGTHRLPGRVGRLYLMHCRIVLRLDQGAAQARRTGRARAALAGGAGAPSSGAGAPHQRGARCSGASGGGAPTPGWRACHPARHRPRQAEQTATGAANGPCDHLPSALRGSPGAGPLPDGWVDGRRDGRKRGL
jgi:hypothetical protein